MKGQMPYGEMQPFQAATGVSNGTLRLKVPEQCPKEFAEMLEMCWAFEPQKRPNMQELFNALSDCHV